MLASEFYPGVQFELVRAELSFFKMATTLLRYDSADKLRFESYFLRPTKKKGRPKKKKRGRPKSVPSVKRKKAKRSHMIAGLNSHML